MPNRSEMKKFGDRKFGGYRERQPFGEREPREMHKAKCAECGKECEVPFKPAEGRPVYCQECFRKRRRF